MKYAMTQYLYFRLTQALTLMGVIWPLWATVMTTWCELRPSAMGEVQHRLSHSSLTLLRWQCYHNFIGWSLMNA